MNKSDRLDNLREVLKKKKRVKFHDLCELISCSPSTLRRDLIILEKEGLIRRLHGEARLNTFNTLELAHVLRETEHLKQKKRIAMMARDFIGPGMCVYLDSSTTAFELCHYLYEIDHLVVYTNGLKVALQLAEYGNPTMKIFIGAGEIKHHSSSVVNADIDNSFADYFNIDLAFYSASGIDESGVYEASLSQALTKRQVLNKTKNNILLIDGSKIGIKKFFKVGEISNYSTIISDKNVPELISPVVINNDIEWIS